MDVSKLPRLSKSDPPPPADPEGEAAPQAQTVRETRTAGESPRDLPESSGAEAWLSFAIGAVLMFMYPHFLQWASHELFGTAASFLPITDVSTGAEIPYPKSIFFFGDLCVFAFGAVLIVEGILLGVLSRRRWAVAIGLLLTVAATGLNLWYVVTSFGGGFPIVSGLAVAYGGYIAMAQWTKLRAMR